MAIRGDDIVSVIKQQIEGFESRVSMVDVGVVVDVDGRMLVEHKAQLTGVRDDSERPSNHYRQDGKPASGLSGRLRRPACPVTHSVAD